MKAQYTYVLYKGLLVIKIVKVHPTKQKHLYTIYTMLDQCLSVGPTLYKCVTNVFRWLGLYRS